MCECRRRVGQPAHHARRRQSGSSLRAEESREIRPFHPVHRDYVLTVVEEVLSHEREVLVRRHAKQDPGLGEEILSSTAGPDRPDLEGDDAIVLVVERLHHPRLAACSQRLHYHVPVLDQRWPGLRRSNPLPGLPDPDGRSLRVLLPARGVSSMHFKILGPLEVYDGDRLLELGGARQRALLAMLLIHAGEVVSSDQLLAELWASASDDGSPKTLQVAVSRLRRALGSNSLLVTRPPGYELRLERGQLDLHLFEAHVAEGRTALGGGDPAAAVREFTAALDLWRGAPLADLTYESFAQEAIGRLQELHASVTEDRLAAQLELGLHAESVAELQVLTGRYPLRERLREQLMLALYRSGRQADALAVYHDARKALVEQLGIEPGRALHQLERAILAQDPALAYHPVSDRPARAALGGPIGRIRRRSR